MLVKGNEQPTRPRFQSLTNIRLEALELGNKGKTGVVDGGTGALSGDRHGGDEASEETLGEETHVDDFVYNINCLLRDQLEQLLHSQIAKCRRQHLYTHPHQRPPVRHYPQAYTQTFLSSVSPAKDSSYPFRRCVSLSSARSSNRQSWTQSGRPNLCQACRSLRVGQPAMTSPIDFPPPNS